MVTNEEPFIGDVTWPVVVNLAWTTAFFFGVPAALEDRSAGPPEKRKYPSVKVSKEASQIQLLLELGKSLSQCPKAGWSWAGLR